MCRLPFYKVYATEKQPCIDLIFRSFFSSLHKPFLLSYKMKRGAEKCGHDKPDLCILFLKLGGFPCYLTADVCNSRVLKLQNEFLY